MLTANKIVKEQMVQTTSKKIVRPSEKRKPRACVPHTPYVKTESLCGLRLAENRETRISGCFGLSLATQRTLVATDIYKSTTGW